MDGGNEIKKNKDYIIEITGQTHGGMGVGKLLEVIVESPDRKVPVCPVYKRCGGCQLQHISYEGQLSFKKQVVKDALERIGGLKDVIIRDTIGMKNPWHYRNKAQLPVGTEKEEVQIGFYVKRSHEIINFDDCMLQDKENPTVFKIIRQFIDDFKISIYDESTGTGLIRHIILKKGFRTREVMAGIVINGDGMPHSVELVEALRKNIPGIKTIVLNINKKKTNTIKGLKNKIIYGNGFIYDYIGDLKFRISLLSFFQVNPVQTEILYSKVMEYAGLTGEETVIDAYCGIGTISLFLAEKAKKVYGVEIVKQAIIDARENARLNEIENAEFILGEAEIEIPKLYAEGVRADVIVVDPPRKGCDGKLLETIAEIAPR